MRDKLHHEEEIMKVYLYNEMKSCFLRKYSKAYRLYPRGVGKGLVRCGERKVSFGPSRRQGYWNIINFFLKMRLIACVTRTLLIMLFLLSRIPGSD